MPCASASEERATLPYNSVQQKFVPKECPQRAASSSASKDDSLQRVYCKTVCHQILFQPCPPESVLHRRLWKLSQKGVSGECCTMVSHKGVLQSVLQECQTDCPLPNKYGCLSGASYELCLMKCLMKSPRKPRWGVPHKKNLQRARCRGKVSHKSAPIELRMLHRNLSWQWPTGAAPPILNDMSFFQWQLVSWDLFKARFLSSGVHLGPWVLSAFLKTRCVAGYCSRRAWSRFWYPHEWNFLPHVAARASRFGNTLRQPTSWQPAVYPMSNWYRPAAQSRLQELPSGSKAARVGGLGQHFTDRLRLPRQPWENIAARHQFIGWKSQAIQNLPVLVLKRERTQAQILHHHMNHIMQASLLAEGICALAHVLLADVGPHAATATCEIFHVWPPPLTPEDSRPEGARC